VDLGPETLRISRLGTPGSPYGWGLPVLSPTQELQTRCCPQWRRARAFWRTPRNFGSGHLGRSGNQVQVRCWKIHQRSPVASHTSLIDPIQCKVHDCIHGHCQLPFSSSNLQDVPRAAIRALDGLLQKAGDKRPNIGECVAPSARQGQMSYYFIDGEIAFGKKGTDDAWARDALQVADFCGKHVNT
jgi:hypothetical protein